MARRSDTFCTLELVFAVPANVVEQFSIQVPLAAIRRSGARIKDQLRSGLACETIDLSPMDNRTIEDGKARSCSGSV